MTLTNLLELSEKYDAYKTELVNVISSDDDMYMTIL